MYPLNTARFTYNLKMSFSIPFSMILEFSIILYLLVSLSYFFPPHHNNVFKVLNTNQQRL